MFVQFGLDDDRGALFVTGFVELPHYWVLVGVHGERAEADHIGGGFGVSPFAPKASNGKGLGDGAILGPVRDQSEMCVATHKASR